MCIVSGSFPIERRAYRHVGEVHEKGYVTLISTYLVAQMESQCLIIRVRRVFSTQARSVLKTPERLIIGGRRE